MVLSPQLLKIVLVVAIVLSLVKLVTNNKGWARRSPGLPQPFPLERFEDGEEYEDGEEEYEDGEEEYEDGEEEYEDGEEEYEDGDEEYEDGDEEYEDGDEEYEVDRASAPTAGMMNVATDLLPKPTWTDQSFSEFAPKALVGQTFLDTNKYIGVDTKGSSLRNPSYDLRSTPSIPRKDIGPWSQSTIDSDLYRKPLE
jgi:hypothetical protein